MKDFIPEFKVFKVVSGPFVVVHRRCGPLTCCWERRGWDAKSNPLTTRAVLSSLTSFADV